MEIGNNQDQSLRYSLTAFSVYSDKVVQGVFTARALSSTSLISNYKSPLEDKSSDGIDESTLRLEDLETGHETTSSWQLSKDLSEYPQYHSPDLLADAIYNLSLEEMVQAIEPDRTFRTGKEWVGVWTRDISYSIILSMAILQPKVAANSLMRKVAADRIVQDTGTGGAYPVSSDRMIWVVAAWEVYKVTGEREWLETAYRIAKNSFEDDLKNIYNKHTGLVKGESSFLDWREQTYPAWMEPADIYNSENLGTNAVHYQSNIVLAEMAELLGDDAAIQIYQKHAARIKDGLNKHLWSDKQGYYGQFLYGRTYKILSPRAEALGESLAIIFGIADDKEQVLLKHTPVNAFGIPCIYPQIPELPPYHNQAVWPFVQSFWALAAAKGEQEQSVLHSIASIYRATALFLTNKENFVNNTGDYAGTQINSSNMLWSLSGNLSLVYSVLFGMHYGTNQLEFSPFVPKVYGGLRKLRNFKYRNAVLDLEMEGYGSKILSFKLDNKKLDEPNISSDLTGRHKIAIVLGAKLIKRDAGRISEDYTSLEAPVVSLTDGMLHWNKQEHAVHYRIMKNGKLLVETEACTLQVSIDQFSEFQVIAVDKLGFESFASAPVSIVPEHLQQIIAFASIASADDNSNGGDLFVNISTTENTNLRFKIEVTEDGEYAIDIRYANGNGPISTENKCAIRTLECNGVFSGTFVFPQRGTGAWSDWGFSNKLIMNLRAGQHELALRYLPHNMNMNGEINQAFLDHMRIIRL
jgi:hypothetical protein